MRATCHERQATSAPLWPSGVGGRWPPHFCYRGGPARRTRSRRSSHVVHDTAPILGIIIPDARGKDLHPRSSCIWARTTQRKNAKGYLACHPGVRTRVLLPKAARDVKVWCWQETSASLKERWPCKVLVPALGQLLLRSKSKCCYRAFEIPAERGNALR